MVVGTPCTLIEVRATACVPAPLNRPGDLASTTVPATPAPEGIATTPSTATDWASVPVKESPALAVLVSIVLPMRTTRLCRLEPPTGEEEVAAGAGLAPSAERVQEPSAAAVELTGLGRCWRPVDFAPSNCQPPAADSDSDLAAYCTL